MNIRRKCFAVLLTLVLLLGMAVPVCAVEVVDSGETVRQIINYYRYHKDEAKTDISCLIYGMAEHDLPQAQAWASIMDYWSYVNNDMTIYPDVLPDGLPKTDALCIVVLGYQLNSNGSMRAELICRLEAALASAEKYPEALIVCSGGGTAKNNKSVTEAGQMAQWLIDKGIAKDRIVVEDKSMSTTGNARNTCSILAESYPQITHLAIVTTDYHLPRACLLFHAQATLNAAETGTQPLCVAANAAFSTGIAPESFDLQLDNLLAIAGVKLDGMKMPQLSKLESIVVSGSAQCAAGAEPELQVMAYYDTGLYRDVTNHATHTELFPYLYDVQDVTVTYEEKGITVTSTVQIELLAPPTEPPTEPPTKAPTEVPTEPATEPVPDVEEKDPFSKWLILAGIVIVLLFMAEILILIKLIRLKKQERAARAALEEEKIELPDDDSPVEYV